MHCLWRGREVGHGLKSDILEAYFMHQKGSCEMLEWLCVYLLVTRVIDLSRSECA